MAGLVGEAVNLVLDGGAIARPYALDLPVEHGRAVEVGPDNVVGLGRGVDEVTAHLGTPILDFFIVGRRSSVVGLWVCGQWLHHGGFEAFVAEVEGSGAAGL